MVGLLVVLVALGLRTKGDWAVRLLAIVFVFTAGLHNWRSWESSLPAFRNGFVNSTLNNRVCDF